MYVKSKYNSTVLFVETQFFVIASGGLRQLLYAEEIQIGVSGFSCIYGKTYHFTRLDHFQIVLAYIY